MSLRDEAPGKLNLLVAYPYMTKPVVELLVEHKEHIRFLLDSGAFTAWKAGKSIALDDYCRFVDSMPFEPWRYFTLDVIGDPVASMANYEAMLARGYKPVPILTRGEDLAGLDRYYETSDVVGIGGLVGTRGNKGFVNGIMKHVGDRRVHWLGFTRINYLKHYRPYMCDSSNYSRGQRYGIIDTYAGNGEMIPLTRKVAKRHLTEALAARVARYDLDLWSLAQPGAWRKGRVMTELPVWSWVDFSLDAERTIGTKLFVAVSGLDSIKLVLRAYLGLRGLKP